MTPVLILKGDSKLPSDYEVRLANGAMVVFGDRTLSVITELRAQGGLAKDTIIASEDAKDLALPRVLMSWALVFFVHTMPGIVGRGPSRMEIDEWRDKLCDHLAWVERSEPRPELNFVFNQGTPNVMMQIMWSAEDDQDWQGVYSTQIKRIAVALFRRWRSAPNSLPAG